MTFAVFKNSSFFFRFDTFYSTLPFFHSLFFFLIFVLLSWSGITTEQKLSEKQPRSKKKDLKDVFWKIH